MTLEERSGAMTNMNAMIWLFPVLFMLHDFEEIILVEAWKKRYKSKLDRIKSGKLVFSGCDKTSAFSIGVAIEFLIFSLVTLLSSWRGTYSFWYVLFLGFTIHLIGHCLICILYKFYVPGVITSILFLPWSLYILYTAYQSLSFNVAHIFIYAVTGIVAMLLLIHALHGCMGMFEKALKKYEHYEKQI